MANNLEKHINMGMMDTLIKYRGYELRAIEVSGWTSTKKKVESIVFELIYIDHNGETVNTTNFYKVTQ